jgi:hypothetical protein
MNIGWGFTLLLLLFGVWNAAATAGWYKLQRAVPGHTVPAFWKLFLIRMESVAVNFLVPTAGLGGESLKSIMAASEDGIPLSASLVAADRYADILAAAVFILIALAPACFFAASPGPVVIWILLPVLLLLVLMIAGIYFAPVLGRWKPLDRRFPALSLSMSNGALSRAAQSAAVWHLAERFLMAGEIWLAAHLLGTDLGADAAIFTSGVAMAAGFLFFFIPGQLGAFDGGLAYAFHLSGLNPALGLSVAMVRRARQIIVCLAGITILLLIKRRAGPKHALTTAAGPGFLNRTPLNPTGKVK